MSKQNVVLKIAKIAGITLAVMAGLNYLFSSIEDKLNLSRTRNGQFYNWRLGKIFYRKRGSGSPLLIVHGFAPGSSSESINDIAERFKDDHTVYTIDLLGFGLSDKPTITYTNYIYVVLVKEFIRDIIGEKADIVACGGSCLSILQANKMGEANIGSVMLFDPCYYERFRSTYSVANVARKLVDVPIIGTFAYNVFCLVQGAVFNRDGKDVRMCKLSGHLTTDISGREDLLLPNVTVVASEEVDFDLA